MNKVWEAVLFDWDDTLCGAEPHRFAFARQVASELGIELELSAVYAGFVRAGDSAAGSWPAFVERLPGALGVPDTYHAAFVERYRERDAVRTFRLFDDVLHVLEELAGRRVRVGIISNNDEAGDHARAMDVHHRVEIIATPTTFGVGKPDPRIFAEALTLLGIAPSRALYVGDSYDHDIVGARAAGMTPVLIDRFGINPRPHDVLRIASLTELSGLFHGVMGAG